MSVPKKWLWLSWVIAASLVREPAPTVRTRSGLVRGRSDPGGTFYQYFGIPYGTVNDTNRFQAPFPPPKWDGILEADAENTKCPQIVMGLLVIGDQDCLKLNIYSPVKRPSNGLLPVMVYIHGGGFKEGTGSGFLYGGDFFVEHGVIFVGINYRLNVEGYLCLGIREAPGNAGLKDQITALKWIKENIEAFGGDPDNVTLFGESAGAASTSFLLLTSAAEGLIHKAILQSGSSLAPWAIQHDPIKTARELAKELGFDSSNPYELYNFFSKKTAGELINAVHNPKYRSYSLTEFLFSPCIEKNINGTDPAITKHPADIIVSGNYSKVPMIIGFTNKEGIFFSSLRPEVIDLNQVLPSDLEFRNDSTKSQILVTMARHYFQSTIEITAEGVINLHSDLLFKYPSTLESELYSKTSNQLIYYYLFKYSGYLNLSKMISLFWMTPGASHGDDLFYMFKPHSFPIPFRYFERKMLLRILTLWTNFAKYSDPTPTTFELLPVRWLPSQGPIPQALVIDSDLSVGPMWDEASFIFWNDTYSKFRKKHYGFT